MNPDVDESCAPTEEVDVRAPAERRVCQVMAKFLSRGPATEGQDGGRTQGWARIRDRILENAGRSPEEFAEDSPSLTTCLRDSLLRTHFPEAAGADAVAARTRWREARAAGARAMAVGAAGDGAYAESPAIEDPVETERSEIAIAQGMTVGPGDPEESGGRRFIFTEWEESQEDEDKQSEQGGGDLPESSDSRAEESPGLAVSSSPEGQDEEVIFTQPDSQDGEEETEDERIEEVGEEVQNEEEEEPTDQHSEEFFDDNAFIISSSQPEDEQTAALGWIRMLANKSAEDESNGEEESAEDELEEVVPTSSQSSFTEQRSGGGGTGQIWVQKLGQIPEEEDADRSFDWDGLLRQGN